jgi:hypothetical protein
MFHNDDYNELFLEPKTKQYGSHMVMTNVKKSTKMKYLSIDSKFCDEYGTSTVANIQYTLPERMNDVKSMEIISLELPMTMYNISSVVGNNNFNVTAIDASGELYKGQSVALIIPDGNYTIKSLWLKISSLLSVNDITRRLNFHYISMPSPQPDAYFFYYDALGDQPPSARTFYNMYSIDFTSNGKYNFKNSLGWLLGYRSPIHIVQYRYDQEPSGGLGWHPEYISPNGPDTGSENYQTDGQPIYIPEKYTDLLGPKYLYLAVDEYTSGNQTSFISQVNTTFIGKNIMAKIVLDTTKYGYGTILPVGKQVGNLFCQKRLYNGRVDIQKLNIQILNEYGNPVDFNGMDFGMTFSIEYE